jgi:hypothetical protein
MATPTISSVVVVVVASMRMAAMEEKELREDYVEEEGDWVP